jgi:hypothetical protein
VAAINGAIVQ